jgi:exodeoxyribonuclease V alpha subunit
VNGSVERIVFLNPENDYTVARLEPEERAEPFTAVGHLAGVQPGDRLQLTGSWVTDPRFGEQFKVSRYRIIPPSTRKGIIRFLSSKLIQGIGKGYAEKIYDTFGDETLSVISNQPERLREVKGLGEKRSRKLLESWKANYAVRDIMMFLQNFDISSAFASRIYKQYGFDSIRTVQENPYRLATDISGIGFLTADRIARSMGIPHESPQRIEAGIVHVLLRRVDAGNVYLPQPVLLEEAARILEISEDRASLALEVLIRNGWLCRRTSCAGEQAIYHVSLLEAEDGVAAHFQRLLAHPSRLERVDIERELETAENTSHIAFSEAQRRALAGALEKKVLVITGGPGTGKTTLVRALTEIYSRLELTLELAAPTGRAAKRLCEATLREARTIHRMLEYNPRRNDFVRNEDHPLEADAVIVDEASMIDLSLMHSLLAALPDRSVLVLVGDVDQLPSVGPGKMLRDVIASGTVPTVRLSRIFRQAQGSNIIVNAHRINEGLPIETDNDRDGNFFFIPKESPEEIVALIEKMVTERIPARFGLDPKKDIQVLTPMHKTVIGVTQLNFRLQKCLNPLVPVNVRRHLNIAPGDKVMQTANNYEKDIFNGDIGFIRAIDEEEQKVWITFDGREVDFSYPELDDVVLAYAITIHKAQGSEYGAVIVPVSTHHYTMLQRNLIYTAVTRGKKLVVLVGTSKALSIAIQNDRIQYRFSDLEGKLAALRAPV